MITNEFECMNCHSTNIIVADKLLRGDEDTDPSTADTQEDTLGIEAIQYDLTPAQVERNQNEDLGWATIITAFLFLAAVYFYGDIHNIAPIPKLFTTMPLGMVMEL